MTCSSPPDNRCGAEGEIEIFNAIGWCENGDCKYTSWLESCDGGLCNGGVCSADPCEGKICILPPKPTCLDEDSVASFNPIGRCIAPQGYAQCRYNFSIVDCPGVCVDGACQDTPCAGVTCALPPSRFCEGDTAHWYNPIGFCASPKGAPECNYLELTEFCDQGCEEGHCLTSDECDIGPCLSPPASYCNDNSTLMTYLSPGYCEAGVCQYQRSLKRCVTECRDGQCEDEPCAGVSCLSPPANYCDDSTHLIAFASPGTCQAGVCEHKRSIEICAKGCKNGQCLGDP